MSVEIADRREDGPDRSHLESPVQGGRAHVSYQALGPAAPLTGLSAGVVGCDRADRLRQGIAGLADLGRPRK